MVGMNLDKNQVPTNAAGDNEEESTLKPKEEESTLLERGVESNRHRQQQHHHHHHHHDVLPRTTTQCNKHSHTSAAGTAAVSESHPRRRSILVVVGLLFVVLLLAVAFAVTLVVVVDRSEPNTNTSNSSDREEEETRSSNSQHNEESKDRPASGFSTTTISEVMTKIFFPSKKDVQGDKLESLILSHLPFASDSDRDAYQKVAWDKKVLPLSPQVLALEWVLSFLLDHYDDIDKVDDMDLLQRYALAVLFYGTGGLTTWFSDTSDSWLNTSKPEIASFCDWGLEDDVRCTTMEDDGATIVITGIGLANDGLVVSSGALPVFELTLLSTSLQKLDLGGVDNSFVGTTMPTEFGLLTELKSLLLDDTGIGGEIPSELGYLTKLTLLAIQGNALEGQIPTELYNMPALKFLKLHSNTLEGPALPPLWTTTSSPSLMVLDLYGNSDLTGTIPCDHVAAGSLSLPPTIPFVDCDNIECGPCCFGVNASMDGAFYRCPFVDSTSPSPSSSASPSVSATDGPSSSPSFTSRSPSSSNSPSVSSSDGPSSSPSFTSRSPSASNSPSLPPSDGPSSSPSFTSRSPSSSNSPSLSSSDGPSSSPSFDNSTSMAPTETEFDANQRQRIELQALILDHLPLSSTNEEEAYVALWEDDKSSPQSLALDWVLLSMSYPQSATVLLNNVNDFPYPPDEEAVQNNEVVLLQRYATVIIFFSTGGSTTWLEENSASWLNLTAILLDPSSICEWGLENDVQCGIDNTTNTTVITGIGLANDGLESSDGTIPAMELSLLSTSLQALDLGGSDNSFVGATIPTELALLTELTSLYLDDVLLTGPIPSELGLLSNLVLLDLHGNALTGTIPTELFALTQLTVLRLHENALTGPIPTELFGLPSLTFVYLHANDLSGPAVPSTWDTTISSLQLLRIHDNPDLTGTIPCDDLSSLSLFPIIDCDLIVCEYCCLGVNASMDGAFYLCP